MDVKFTTFIFLSALIVCPTTSNKLFFNGSSSLLQITSATVPLKQGFDFTFRTCVGGALLSQSGNNGVFFIDVNPGTVNFSNGAFVQSQLTFGWPDAQNVQNTIKLGNNLDKNLYQTVTFSPGNGNTNSSVSVSDGINTFSASVPNTILDFVGSGPLYVGDASRGGFVGCMESGKNIVLQKKAGSTVQDGCPLDSQVVCPKRECPAGFTGYYCEVNIDECSGDSCHSFSTCVDGINNYTCVCGPRYTGRLCDTFLGSLCIPSPCVNGGACRESADRNNYTCFCSHGFTGRNCSIKVSPCDSSPCLHSGTCEVEGANNDTFKCQCPTGFRGQRCEQDIDDCASVPCHFGQCIDGIGNYTCNCTGSGYDGPTCQNDINECNVSSPCQNNGTCLNVGGTYQCRCSDGFEGKNCDVNIDECTPDICQNGGTCQDRINNYACQCTPGFNGRNCENDIDDCRSDSCNNHSICIDAVDNFTCICLPGYTGLDCGVDIDECDPNPCLNSGNCTQGINHYNCSCQDRHNGTNCEFDTINDCVPDPCQNNATCYDGFDGFNCTCQLGFGGKRCELLMDSCHPSPCINNATCYKVGESYNCSCLSGFEGVNCSINIDDCANISCVGNAICIDGINNYTCRCLDGFGGNNCEVNINECDSNPCENNATCTDGINGFNCTCPFGYDGVLCENNIDDCPSHGCYNGTCLDGIGNYTCNCSSGFEGRNCENDINECLRVLCNNSGTCVNTPGSYRCQCTPYATGQYCEKDIDECKATPKPCNEPYGICVNHPFKEHKCFCSDGFHGKDCKTNIDDCKLRDPCENGATCIDKTADFDCVCTEGWTSKNCSQDINECDLGFCQNGATCENFDGTYTCSCVPGYTDRNCSTDIDECASLPCEHNSTCQDLLNDFNCSCTAGYTGKNCSVDIDECFSDPCLNNGTCIDLVADFNCSCNANYTGRQCQYRISSCMPVNPCANNGTCLEGQFNNFTCRCQPGFTGDYCRNITTVGFNGSSYMTVDTSEGDFVLSLQFRTTLVSGLLAADSDGKLSLRLKGDRLELQYHGSVLSAGKGANLANGLWHRVTLNVSARFLSLEIDNSSCGVECFSSDNSISRPVKVGRLFLGGIRSVIPAVVNFTGCIQDVVINERTVIPHEPGTELFYTTVGCPRVAVCSPQPCVHGRCVDKWIEYQCECERPWAGEQCNTSFIAGTFGATASLNPSGRNRRDLSNMQNASYAKFLTNGLIIDNNLDISFFIRTRASGGLVTLLTDSSNTRTVTIALDNGEIVVEFNNTGAKSNITSNYKVNDGDWHFVSVNSNISKVDNQTFPGISVWPAITLEHTYIGGLEDYSVYPSGALPTETPFRGCVQDMRLNDKPFQFYPLNISVDSYQLLALGHVDEGCPGQDVCGAYPCGRGGVCRDLWDEYRCDCHPRYGGRDCSLYGCALVNLCPSNTSCVDVGEHYECVHPATFNGSSSSVDYYMTSNASVDAELSFELRTRYTDAVVMEISEGADELAVQIKNGFLTVVYSIEGATGNVTSDVVVSDGQWHKVQLNSSSGITSLTVDQQRSSSSGEFTAGGLTQLLRQAKVVLSNHSRPFKGCLNAVRVGGLLLPFVDYYDSNINVSHLTPLKPHFNTSSGLKSGCHGDDTCAPGPCEQGACRDIWNDFSCSCYEGWAGRFCNRTANMTCAHKPCKENSTCFNLTNVMVTNETQLSQEGVDMFRCSCIAGFYGKVCDKPTDECAPQPCQNGGNCTDSHLNYTCACAVGFTGRNCSVNIDDCASHNCSNNATCVDGIDEYNCKCAAGFNGTFCTEDIDECASGRVGPCTDNGTVSCNNTEGSFLCTCKTGYFGGRCEHDPTESCELLKPCVKGTCSDNSTGFYCNCPKGFSGKRCEIDIRECEDQPCSNNGTCVDSHSNETQAHFAGYKCLCSVDYKGSNCDTLVTPCEPTNPCQNNGSCVRLTFNTSWCNCTEGFGNANCSGLTRFCQPNPCAHGKCTPLMDDFLCGCNTGYQGKRCDDLINKCDSKPCKNGGSCKSVDSSFECTCVGDWIGQQCQTSHPCKTTPCENGGTCSLIEAYGNFSCACGEEFTGLRCELRKNTEPEKSTGEMPAGVIVGIVAACLLLLLFVVVLIIFVRKRADNGTYSPSRQEIDCGRVEMNPIMKPPAPERLI